LMAREVATKYTLWQLSHMTPMWTGIAPDYGTDTPALWRGVWLLLVRHLPLANL
jgi:hypothetical protein